MNIREQLATITMLERLIDACFTPELGYASPALFERAMAYSMARAHILQFRPRGQDGDFRGLYLLEVQPT